MPSATHLTSQLTPEEFDALADRHPRLTPSSRRLARAVLVEGRTPKEMADEADLTPARVSAIVRTVYLPTVPPGWHRRVVTLPAHLMPQLRALELLAAAHATPGLPPPSQPDGLAPDDDG